MLNQILKSKTGGYPDIKIIDERNGNYFYRQIMNSSTLNMSVYSRTKEELKEDYILPKEKWVPKMNKKYFISDPTIEKKYTERWWSNNDVDNFFLERGNVHKTTELAIAMTDKFIKLAQEEN